jgi:hypothetical protein
LVSAVPVVAHYAAPLVPMPVANPLAHCVVAAKLLAVVAVVAVAALPLMLAVNIVVLVSQAEFGHFDLARTTLSSTMPLIQSSMKKIPAKDYRS